MTQPGDLRPMDDALGRLSTCPSSHVVVGFDGSPSSISAMSFAVGVAARTSAHLTVVFVSGRTLPFADLYTGATLNDDTDGVRAAVLREASTALREVATRWAYVGVVGRVAVELDRVAARMRADVIVVENAGRVVVVVP